MFEYIHITLILTNVYIFNIEFIFVIKIYFGRNPVEPALITNCHLDLIHLIHLLNRPELLRRGTDFR